MSARSARARARDGRERCSVDRGRGFLVALKLVAGLAAGSLGLVAEAAHSGTDLVAALLTFLALRVARAARPTATTPTATARPSTSRRSPRATFLVVASFFIVSGLDRRLTGATSTRSTPTGGPSR